MSGFTEYQASDASGVPYGQEIVLTWHTACNMLSLVRRIVADIALAAQQLDLLKPEKERLDRQRHSLDWPKRARRYQIGEDILREETRLRAAAAELESLGVVLIDAELGQVGFPTIVNNRRAFFSWRQGEEGLDLWHFAGSLARRPIPSSWKETTEKRRPSKRRSGPRE